MVMNDGVPAPLFAPPRVTVTDAGPDADRGSLLLRSADPLGRYPRTVLDSVRAWARADPGRVLVAEREGAGEWRICRYGGAVAAADSIGQALLDRGLGPDRPLLVLSGNSIDRLMVTLGAMSAGIPVAPVSAAYSLQSADHARIRTAKPKPSGCCARPGSRTTRTCSWPGGPAWATIG